MSSQPLSTVDSQGHESLVSSSKPSYFYHGNYHHYYKKRPSIDDRIKLFSSSWFAKSDCLDIGCNDGALTMKVAEVFNPRMILGVDIDPFLIDAAKSRVKRALNQINTEDKTEERKRKMESDHEKVKKPMLFAPRIVNIKKSTVSTISSSSNPPSFSAVPSSSLPLGPTSFPHNASFYRSSILEYSPDHTNVPSPPGGKFHTILCLSVVKWLHLSQGDEGLLEFFRHVRDLLHDGGLFILEYQPWKSYKKQLKLLKKQLQDTKDDKQCSTSEIASGSNEVNTKQKKSISQLQTDIQRISEIKLLPHAFEQILTAQFHFEVVKKLNAQSEEDSLGYFRPTLVLRKAIKDEEETTSLS